MKIYDSIILYSEGWLLRKRGSNRHSQACKVWVTEHSPIQKATPITTF